MAIVTANRQASGYTSKTGLDLASIHPSQGAKYSPNLHAYLSRRCSPLTAAMARVFEDESGTQWLGFVDDTDAFIGQRLQQVLSYGARAQTFSYQLPELREVEDFWTRYVRDGRCAIDVRHRTPFIGSDTRWRVRGNERECTWCGNARQRLVQRTKVTTTEEWESC